MTQLEVLSGPPNREMAGHLTRRSKTHLTKRPAELPVGSLWLWLVDLVRLSGYHDKHELDRC